MAFIFHFWWPKRSTALWTAWKSVSPVKTGSPWAFLGVLFLCHHACTDYNDSIYSCGWGRLIQCFWQQICKPTILQRWARLTRVTHKRIFIFSSVTKKGNSFCAYFVFLTVPPPTRIDLSKDGTQYIGIQRTDSFIFGRYTWKVCNPIPFLTSVVNAFFSPSSCHISVPLSALFRM